MVSHSWMVIVWWVDFSLIEISAIHMLDLLILGLRLMVWSGNSHDRIYFLSFLWCQCSYLSYERRHLSCKDCDGIRLIKINFSLCTWTLNWPLTVVSGYFIKQGVNYIYNHGHRCSSSYWFHCCPRMTIQPLVENFHLHPVLITILRASSR